jgi:hypothetical protein
MAAAFTRYRHSAVPQNLSGTAWLTAHAQISAALTMIKIILTQQVPFHPLSQ